jgi:hypothetical protein
LLRSHSGDTGGDTRKIRIGLLALALATVVVLNVGIYQGAQNRLVHDRWGDLANATDATRERLRSMFQTADRQLRFAMDQPGFAARAHAALAGTIDGRDARHSATTEPHVEQLPAPPGDRDRAGRPGASPAAPGRSITGPPPSDRDWRSGRCRTGADGGGCPRLRPTAPAARDRDPGALRRRR